MPVEEQRNGKEDIKHRNEYSPQPSAVNFDMNMLQLLQDISHLQ